MPVRNPRQDKYLSQVLGSWGVDHLVCPQVAPCAPGITGPFAGLYRAVKVREESVTIPDANAHDRDVVRLGRALHVFIRQPGAGWRPAFARLMRSSG